MSKDPITEIRSYIQSMEEFRILYNFSAIEQDEKFISLIAIYTDKIKKAIEQYEQKTGKKI